MAGSNRRFALVVSLLLLLLVAMSGWARAATLTVTNTTDPITPVAGDGSLRGALLAAGGGDTIVFAAGLTGTINLLAGNGPLEVAASITITGPTASPGIATSGQGATRVMVVATGLTVSIANLTIENGSSGNGGGILNNGGLTVTNCTFFENEALTGVGGGIDNEGGLTVIGSTFSDNSALGGGGGIFNDGTLTVIDSTLSVNGSFVGGGGIFNEAGATFEISDSTFSDNSAGTEGGGMFIQAGVAPMVSASPDGIGSQTIARSTFVDNSATTNGGAIENDSTLTVINCTFSGNTANTGGGGINNTGTLKVTNATFEGNTAAGGASPGGIDNTGTASLRSTILADQASGGNCEGTVTDAGYNIADDSTCAFVAPSINNSTTIRLDPAGLANNGGPTQTIALEPNSQAVDFIPVASCKDQSFPTPLAVAIDQRGFPRPDSGNLSFCDAGAFELQTGRITVVPGSEQTQIARPTTSSNSDHVNTTFTFVDNGSPPIVDGVGGPLRLRCDTGNDALNGISVDLFEGTCATLATTTGGLLLDLSPFVVHTIDDHSYGTIFQSDPPDMLQQTGETVLARIVRNLLTPLNTCGEWTIHIEVAGLDTAAIGLGGGNPFALVLEDGDKNVGCFDVTNAVVGGQLPLPPRKVRRGARR